ncbi:MAG: PVC-type heme-binding CxxCH protein [Limisphaerales bacterium]
MAGILAKRLECAWLATAFLSFTAYGLPPQESLNKMTVPPAFVVQLVASEPEIRQPLCLNFDDRGRLWVLQYIQYPTPAGLKPIKVDQYLRTTYDRIPEPPPRGPKGADKITICDDFDKSGHARRYKDFITGLNLCTGFAIGQGGVFVMQSPYLLFYSDKNRDDVPDGDPEVLLTGFGMEDAHAFANSLTWGPDGWLYGVQGSTVTAHVHGVEFQQGVWRYHPITHQFELFAEGGGNLWGLDFDDDGEIFCGTNASEQMLHALQGAYYAKNFGKHGALHNPYTFGYFEHVPHTGNRGHHLSTGGIIYNGGAFPTEFNHAYISGHPLDTSVYWSTLKPHGSTFQSTFGGEILKTDDNLFRPVNCRVGPDGAVYIADWCDKRVTHVDPLDTWDRSNGRVYRVQYAQANTNVTLPLLETKASAELLQFLNDKNEWFAREARRILAERRDASVVPQLLNTVLSSTNAHLQLESLWALYVSGGFNEATAAKLLHHSNANIRKWTVRLLADSQNVSTSIREALVELARNEQNAQVRAQLACSAKRVPGEDALAIIHELILRNEDANDPCIPLLDWWALENKTISNRDAVVKMFSDDRVWNSSIATKEILEKVARRYASENDLDTCMTLLRGAGSQANRIGPILKGMDAGLAKSTRVPDSFDAWIKSLPPKSQNDVRLIRLGVRMQYEPSATTAQRLIIDETVPKADRISLIDSLAQNGNPRFLPLLTTLLRETKSEAIRNAALSAVERYSDPQIASDLIDLYPHVTPATRTQIINALCTRPSWASGLVATVEAKKLTPKDVSLEQLRQIAAFKVLLPRIEKIWGKIQTSSPAEKQNTINRLKLVIEPRGAAGRDATGNPAEGKKLFQKTCAVCHTLFGEGNKIGPDLTGIDRKNLDVLLLNIVNPSAYIRPEYVNFDIETKDDQNLSGLVVDSSPTSVTVLDRNNQKHTIPRDNLRALRESQLSLMPEGLLESLLPKELMDLFSYLQRDSK